MTATVEVWLTRSDAPAARARRWFDCLDAGERARAARFADPIAAEAFVTRHAMLRHVLARRAGLRPEAMGFTIGPFGKPALRTAAGQRPAFFSLSGSGPVALLAVGDTGDIGADVERVLPSGLEAAALFTARERADLARRSGDEALRAFYRYWVCKEAVAKALGRGLAIPLDGIEISAPDTPPAVLRGHDDPGPTVFLKLVHPAENLLAAIATFTPVEIDIRSWPGGS